MDETKYENAMQIILHAGSAKSAALMAIDAAAEGDFDAAKAHFKKSQDELHEAHAVQFGLIQDETSGDSVEVNIILVHAQDHLSMAFTACDMAERMIGLYRRVSELESR